MQSPFFYRNSEEANKSGRQGHMVRLIESPFPLTFPFSDGPVAVLDGEMPVDTRCPFGDCFNFLPLTFIFQNLEETQRKT